MSTKSLNELEAAEWIDAVNATPLVLKCMEYRRIPVGDLSVEQLRVPLQQAIGVRHLLPRALSILQENALAEGDCYPGDLLAAVLRLPADAWKGNAACKRQLQALLREQAAAIRTAGNRALADAIRAFGGEPLS